MPDATQSQPPPKCLNDVRTVLRLLVMTDASRFLSRLSPFLPSDFVACYAVAEREPVQRSGHHVF